MFSTDVPTYEIDLERPEEKRWAEMIERERPVADRLVREASAMFERVPQIFRWVFARLYERSGGLYRREMKAWADGLGQSLGTVTMLNCAYELSHLHVPRVFGCTAGVRWLDGAGMIHVRTLDWPLPTMGDATRVFRFRRGLREFVSVGVPGQVGVLSGMVPGGYSVTINWAPPAAFPTFEFGPTFLLRNTLETCATFDSAVEKLSNTKLAASVFFTVCGVEKNQACVIERSPQHAIRRQPTDGIVVQANHHLAAHFAKHNEMIRQVPAGEEEFSIAGSTERWNILAGALRGLAPACSPGSAAKVLDIPSVLNKFTVQQMVFCPRTGGVSVWRKSGGSPT